MSDLCNFPFIVLFSHSVSACPVCLDKWKNLSKQLAYLYICHSQDEVVSVCILILERYVHFSAFLLIFFFFLQYDIVGHSGDGFDIELVRCDKVPKNNKQRLKVLKVCSLRKNCVHSLMFFPFVWKSASWQAFLERSHPSDHETWQGVHRQACFSLRFFREGSFAFKETILVRFECLNHK